MVDEIQISQLPTAGTVEGGDEVPLVKGEETFKGSLNQILADLGVTDHMENTIIHAPIDDTTQANNKIWSSQKVVQHVNQMLGVGGSGPLSADKGGTGLNVVDANRILWSVSQNVLSAIGLDTYFVVQNGILTLDIEAIREALDGNPSPGQGVPDLSDIITQLVFYAHTHSNQNTVVQISTTFAPADVDTGNNQINVTLPLPDTSEGQAGNWQRVYFWSTGQLPAPLEAGKPYIAESTGGVTKIYPLARTTDFWKVLGGRYGDWVGPCQLAAQNSGAIDLTSQGTGTHTIYTQPLMSVWRDLTGNGFDFSNTTGNYNELFEVIEDASGKFLHSYGAMISNYSEFSAHNEYGKRYNNLAGVSFRDRFANRRFVASIAILRPKRVVPSFKTKQVPIDSAAINTGTGVITKSSHGFLTGQKVEWSTVTGALPTPNTGLITDTVYARNLTSSTFTLHPTESDASNNTNVITYSSAGSGNFMLAATQRCAPIDGARYLFDLSRPDANNAHSGNMGFRTPFVGTGTALTRSSFLSSYNGRLATTVAVRPLAPVIVTAPSGVNMPTTTDQNAPVNSRDFITGIDLTNPCVLHFGSTPKVATGETVWIDSIAGTEELNQRWVDNITVDTVNNTVTLNGVDATNFRPWIADGWITPVYYITPSQELPDSRSFLHRTLAQATAQQSVADNVRQCVTFNDYPALSSMTTHDQWRMWYVDDRTWMQMSNSTILPNIQPIYGQKYVVAAKKDYEPTPGTAIVDRTINASSLTITGGNSTITYNNHQLSTGMFLYGDANGGTLPTGIPNGTGSPPGFYVKNLGSNTFSLHPTSADATAGTNAWMPSDAGSGSWQLKRIRPEVMMSLNGGTWDRVVQADADWGRPGNTQSFSFPFILGNAAQPHVPGAWELKALVLLTVPDDNEATLDNLIDTIVDRFKTAEGIT